MASNVYGVVRTDNMYGTDVRAALVSVKYMGSDGATPTEIENGSVVKITSLLEDNEGVIREREIYAGADVATDDDIANIVLIASPEVCYDERERNLEDFINPAGKACRGYHLHSGDCFSVTAEALTGTPAKNAVVELAAGTKLNAAESESGATVVGKIIDVEKAGRHTFYVIKVK